VNTLVIVVVLVVLCLPAVIVAVLRNEGRRSRERVAASIVQVDALGVRRELADGRIEAVHWDEVEVVEVVRASVGPHAASGGVVLVGGPGERGALVPLDRAQSSGLLAYLGQLPGFQRSAWEAAAVGRAPSRTEVWRRGAGVSGDDPDAGSR
jgi:hypothetical protein